MYLDAHQRPLPGGAALGFGPVHQGILAYFDNGQQVILNTSLKHGRPVVSPLEEFNGVRPWLVRPLPNTWEDSIRIQQNAWNLVQAGAPWTIFNNCQDFVSMSYDGKPGSETRKLVAAGATLAVLLGLL
ncbi:MAG: hypothetical protein WCF22_04840 [Candidatus Sulfotelmatobacter sp.]